MFEEKTGAFAGKIWEALNEGGKLTGKELKNFALTKNSISAWDGCSAKVNS